MSEPVALAIAAHPDDIEFMMAGTLLQLAARGWRLHYFNLCSGNCGSMILSPTQARRVRLREARSAARRLGAVFHPPIADDLEVFYADALLRRVAAVVRQADPTVVLTHSPQDYMEDHTNTSRLAVTATFAKGMPNYRSAPSRRAVQRPVAVYHAMPHGLHDGMGVRVEPDLVVETTGVQGAKRDALACHASQKDWLDQTQGMGSYVAEMDRMAAEIGRTAGGLAYAEGWRRHHPLGFAGADFDPLMQALPGICSVVHRRARRKR